MSSVLSLLIPYARRSLSSSLNISTWTTSIIVTYLDQQEKVSTFSFFVLFPYEMTEHRRSNDSYWKERKTRECHSSHRWRRRLHFLFHYIYFPYLFSSISTMLNAYKYIHIWMNTKENGLFFLSFRSNPIWLSTVWI